jgi:hypothetical protein
LFGGTSASLLSLYNVTIAFHSLLLSTYVIGVSLMRWGKKRSHGKYSQPFEEKQDVT